MKISTKALVYIAMVAALYAAITIAQSTFGFGPIQFRIAESLNLLAFFNPIFIPAVTLGVFLANFIGSPYGIIDAGLGTIATVIALLLLRVTKKATGNFFLSSLWVTIANALIVPVVILLSYEGLEGLTWGAYLPFVVAVAIGQFVVVSIFGYAMFQSLKQNQPHFIHTLENL